MPDAPPARPPMVRAIRAGHSKRGGSLWFGLVDGAIVAEAPNRARALDAARKAAREARK